MTVLVVNGCGDETMMNSMIAMTVTQITTKTIVIVTTTIVTSIMMTAMLSTMMEQRR